MRVASFALIWSQAQGLKFKWALFYCCFSACGSLDILADRVSMVLLKQPCLCCLKSQQTSSWLNLICRVRYSTYDVLCNTTHPEANAAQGDLLNRLTLHRPNPISRLFLCALIYLLETICETLFICSCCRSRSSAVSLEAQVTCTAKRRPWGRMAPVRLDTEPMSSALLSTHQTKICSPADLLSTLPR